MCSTHAANYLFPPQELLYLASVAKKGGHETLLVDAIAEKMGYAETIEALRKFEPELVATLTGFECFENDMRVVQQIKEDLPEAKTLCFGYYPTLFPMEIMQKTNIDFLILGEPELVFEGLLNELSKGIQVPRGIKGLVFWHSGRIRIRGEAQRIANLDSLPFPSHELLEQGRYGEPFLGAPYTTIQTSRGCPFQCTYCVSTYGKKLVLRSSESILAEIRFIVNELGIRNFRFIDDTFTVNKRRVMELCNAIIREKLQVNWTCLSRADTLDREMLRKMRMAGCRRLFIGIESGSQRVLDWFRKGYNAEELAGKIRAVKESNIESLGFFVVGSPVETERDLQKSVELARKSRLDYVVVSRLLAYPGTELFERMKAQIDFSLFPYKNEFRSRELEKKWLEREKAFYRAFYLRPSYILRRILAALRSPREFAANAKRLFGYLILPVGERERQDLF
jgi:radical SAM superfamily enzyme YgiQ (UPF0313 family)